MRFFLPQITPQLRMGMRWPDGLRSLRRRNFRLFFFGQLISLIGSWMQTTAQQWLVYRLTGSELSLGVVTFAAFLPVLILSLGMGVIVDRFERRRLLVITQTWFLLQAAVLAVLTALGVIQYQHVIVLALLAGIGNALDMPARQSFYVDLVDRDEMMNAIALNSSVFNGARIIGPAIGGVVIALMGEAPAFGLNAISFLAVIGALLMMRLSPLVPPMRHGSGWSELRQGLAYLVADRRVLGLVSMVAAFSVFGFPYVVLLPAFAGEVLGTGAAGLGALLAAQGVGALASALGLAFLGERRSKGRMLFASRALLPVSVLLLAVSRTPQVSMLALVLGGYTLINQLAITNTLIQMVVPDELRGRVLSTYTWALGGFWPIGALLTGWMAERLGAPQAVLVVAGVSAVLALAGWVAFPEARRMD
ncbi:MAG: MFS transporter [Anaerolineales bacterium]|nr:MFS transporter [Anaerolineales bacterium]